MHILLFLHMRGRCSYRTYEEWKPDVLSKGTFSASSSYRTYEEWKRRRCHDNWDYGSCGSYRTYEEWKLTVVNGSMVLFIKFLPYL